MPARRRRGGSEHEIDPMITTSNSAYQNRDFGHQYYNDRVVSQQLDINNKQQEANLVTMTSRDRTKEFANAIRTMQGRTVARAAVMRDPRQARQIQSYSNFMMIAKNIGKNIASTYTKLEKLALLAKKKSLFDDRPSEIQELTYIIKGDLNSLNQQIAKLQEVGRQQRESLGTTRGHHLASHSSSVVVALQSKLANMSNHFKNVLEVRTENLKQQQCRREQFTQGSVSSSLPPSAVSGRQGSLLLQEQANSSSVSIDLEPAMGQQVMQRQAVLYDETDTYVQSRSDAMQNIESTIVELGGIFQQLAHMVKEQEEMVERIDSNIQDTELNVEAAHGEILKYFQSVTNNRWLMIKIFAVLIFFFIFFVVFVA
ncbi:syntaxin-5 [Neodiprion pinetum]|uniref:Syntaxin-5 n=1 Tax=Neodiprion lecontei TaxID=441921 RepID=A0A6J0CAS9_NEOLC|nr:syntaxin-5 [Neodiprion lecontei]XP_046415090.1 syntaxin-5 [Neodiprion fabricii]XP_046473935.1 syntaxin-5 [Neodiprion pinetum]XP_046612927.1 syntaxin-5 [Neodiprion virginianus]